MRWNRCGGGQRRNWDCGFSDCLPDRGAPQLWRSCARVGIQKAYWSHCPGCWWNFEQSWFVSKRYWRHCRYPWAGTGWCAAGGICICQGLCLCIGNSMGGGESSGRPYQLGFSRTWPAFISIHRTTGIRRAYGYLPCHFSYHGGTDGANPGWCRRRSLRQGCQDAWIGLSGRWHYRPYLAYRGSSRDKISSNLPGQVRIRFQLQWH